MNLFLGFFFSVRNLLHEWISLSAYRDVHSTYCKKDTQGRGRLRQGMENDETFHKDKSLILSQIGLVDSDVLPVFKKNEDQRANWLTSKFLFP